MVTVPREGWFSPPRIDKSVLLPEPDCPMMVTNSPCSMLISTPRSACTVSSPLA